MDELNLDDLFGGKGDGDALFEMDDLVMDFGDEGKDPNLGLEMKWVDPALTNNTSVEGDPATVTPPLPLNGTKKKEKKKKKKKDKTQAQMSVANPFGQATKNDSMVSVGDKQGNKTNKIKSNKKKKPKKPKALPKASDALNRHQYPPQAKPLPSSVTSPPPGHIAPVNVSNLQQNLSRVKKRRKEREVSTKPNGSIDLFASSHSASDTSSKKSSKRRKKEKPPDPFSYNSTQMGIQMPSMLRTMQGPMQGQIQGPIQGQIHPQLRAQYLMKQNQQIDHRQTNDSSNFKNPTMDPTFYSSLQRLSSLNNNFPRSGNPRDPQPPFPPLHRIDMPIDNSKMINQAKRSMNETLQMNQNLQRNQNMIQLYLNSNNLNNITDKNTVPTMNRIGEKNIPLAGKNKKSNKVKTKLDSKSMLEKPIQNNRLLNGQSTSNATKKKKQKSIHTQDRDSFSQSSSLTSAFSSSLESLPKPTESGKLFGANSKYTTPSMLTLQVKVRVDGRIREVSNGVKNLTAHLFVPTAGANARSPSASLVESTSTNHSTRNQASSKDQDVKPKRRRSRSSTLKNAQKAPLPFKALPVMDPVPAPKEPTASNLISFLIDPSNNFTPSQRREKLFAFMANQLQSPEKPEISSKEKARKASISKKKEKPSEKIDEDVSNALWNYTERENYFSEIKDETLMTNLKDAWQPERIEEGSGYWGEMPPVALLKEDKQGTKTKSTSLFDRLQSLLVVEDDDDTGNEQTQEVRNLILESSDTASSSVENANAPYNDIDQGDFDVSCLSLDQRTFIHLRSLHLIDRPYLPNLSPVAIENDSDDEDESLSDDDDEDNTDDPLFSCIHNLRIQLSNINHANNIHTANLQSRVKQYITTEMKGKKQDEDAILAKYLQKKK